MVETQEVQTGDEQDGRPRLVKVGAVENPPGVAALTWPDGWLPDGLELDTNQALLAAALVTRVRAIRTWEDSIREYQAMIEQLEDQMEQVERPIIINERNEGRNEAVRKAALHTLCESEPQWQAARYRLPEVRQAMAKARSERDFEERMYKIERALLENMGGSRG